jgi:hypothetical protein
LRQAIFSVETDHAPENKGDWSQMETYRIQVAGHVDGRWSEWLAGLEVTNQPDGTTILQGPLVDQGALFGVLLRIRDLNVRLLSLQLEAGDGRSV